MYCKGRASGCSFDGLNIDLLEKSGLTTTPFAVPPAESSAFMGCSEVVGK